MEKQWLLRRDHTARSCIRDNSARWEHIEDFHHRKPCDMPSEGIKQLKWQKQGKESYYMRTDGTTAGRMDQMARQPYL